MPDYLINYSCIKGINVSYEDKLAFNKRMRGIDEYQAAKKEARGETGVEPRAATLKEQPARRHRRAVPKRPHGSTSIVEPTPKKARRDSAAEASVSEAVPSGVEEQREEEEEEDETPLVR